MKTISKLGFLALALALMISCSPTSKESYMDKYVSFLDEVSKEYKDYTPGDWEKMDEKFEKFNGEWYRKYEQEFTFKEELKLQAYKMKYAYYRALAEGKSAVEGIVENIDVDQMKKDVDDAAKEVKKAAKETMKAAEEFVNSIDMEQVQKDLEEVGEEILKAAEGVGKTIDSLAGGWQK